MKGVTPHQAGVRDGYAGDRIDPDLFADPDAGEAYRRGLQEGRTHRVDEELVVRTGTRFVQALDRLGAVWSPDVEAYMAGQVDAAAMRCALCETAPCSCPPFGTPEYLALVERRHGKQEG